MLQHELPEIGSKSWYRPTLPASPVVEKPLSAAG